MTPIVPCREFGAKTTGNQAYLEPVRGNMWIHPFNGRWINVTLSLRRKPTSRVRQIRGELAEGFGHLKSATNNAAEGVAHRAAPHVDNALVAVGWRKRPRSRWPWIAGAIAVGTAVGVSAAMLRRNNRRAEEMMAEEPDLKEFQFDSEPTERRSSQLAAASPRTGAGTAV
jgi:hypothetical protein